MPISEAEAFGEAYNLVIKSKKSSADIASENKYYREVGEEMGVSSEGFRRAMQDLDDRGLEDLVGEFTRKDAKLPKDWKEGPNGEYYVRPNGKPVRVVDGKLYVPGEDEFTMVITETKQK